jgi:ABC-2 type transport system ATP-binding protein
MSAGAAISVEGLTKNFGDLLAVDHVTFDVRRGEVFSLLGPNGAGKTTTIRMLTTVDSISEGRATVAGHDVSRDPGSVRRAIGVVPQEVTLDEELPGIQNLVLAAQFHHLPKSEARRRSKDLLRLVELEDSADRKVGTYSGGMKRRLQLVQALIHEPEILILDEPTVGLDVQTRTRLWEYLRHLNRDRGITLVLTTHYLEEADHLANRAAIMDRGVVKCLGTPTELKAALGGDTLRMVFDGDPGDLSPVVRAFPQVAGVVRDGAAYRVNFPNVERTLPSFLSFLSSRGISPSEVSISKATLDEVFLSVTGRSMRDAQESPDGAPRPRETTPEARP